MEGRYPIHSSISESNTQLTNLLCNHHFVNINSLDNLSRSPLHYAAFLGIHNIIPLLLARGTNPALKDSVNEATALHYACSKNHSQVIEISISKFIVTSVLDCLSEMLI